MNKMKISEIISNAFKSAFNSIDYAMRQPDQTLLVKGSIRDRVIRYREQIQDLEIIRPRYKIEQLGCLTKTEVNILKLKHRLNPDNVTDDERRLYTLKCCYYDYAFDSDLILIDKTLIRYFNYFESTTQMIQIDQSEVEKHRVLKNVSVDEKFILDYFSQVIMHYEKMIKKGIILPFDFFTHRAIADITNNVTPNKEALNKNYYFIRQMMVAYSVIYDAEIPDDYSIIDENTSTNIYYLRKLLNNLKVEPADPGTAKPVLTLVK